MCSAISYTVTQSIPMVECPLLISRVLKINDDDDDDYIHETQNVTFEWRICTIDKCIHKPSPWLAFVFEKGNYDLRPSDIGIIRGFRGSAQ